MPNQINKQLFTVYIYIYIYIYIYNYTYVLYTNKLALSANDKEKFKNVVSHLDNSPYICVITRKFMKILIFILI